MSIFFASGNISDSQESENEQIVKNQKAKPTYNFGDDEDYNEKKRTVQTQKEKKWNIIKALCLKITSQLNNSDYEKVWDNLQEVLKEIQKSSKVIEKQGKYPAIFLKTLNKIDEQVQAMTPQAKKQLKKHAATAFNTMKQKLKNKILPEYQVELKKFLQNEEDYESSEEQDKFESQSESDSQSEDGDEDRGDWRSEDIMIRRKYFLKRQKKEDEEEKQRDGEKSDQEEKPKLKQEEKKREPRFHLSDHHQKKKIEIKSVKEAQSKLRNIIGTFHKLTNKDQREEYLDNLNEIVTQSKNYKDFEKLSFLLVDVPIRVQVFRQMKMTHFFRDQWLTVYKHVENIYKIFKESQEEDLLENVQLFNQNSIEKVTANPQESIFKAIQAFLIILETELRKSFIFIDKSDAQYPQRLQDLIKLIDFMYKVSRDLSFNDKLQKEAIDLSFKVLQNMYFMSANFMKKLNTGSEEQLRFTQLADENTLQQYYESILKSGNENHITKTILYIVFNHAINQRQKGKQLLIMSNIPETIHEADYYTQTLFNRCIVQIGINSFYFGKYFEVQQFLSEICGYGYGKDATKDVIREFLAQGYVRGHHQKQIPKNKILPYYLHLNVQLIQSLELIASMILETPYTLIQGSKISAKTFRRIYYEFERSHFIAQPLNSKDLIYAASCELKQGNWKQCYERLLQLGVWKDVENAETAQKKMLQIIKEYSLKCYLLAHRKCFKSISLINLIEKFQMQDKNIRKLISKWIYSRQILGSINQNGFLVLAQKKQSPMQKLCENLYNRLEDIRKSQEQVMEKRFSVIPEEQQDAEKEEKDRLNRRFNLAMSEKLRAILNKRN